MTSIEFTKISTYAGLYHCWENEDYQLDGLNYELHYCEPISRDQAVDDEGHAMYDELSSTSRERSFTTRLGRSRPSRSNSSHRLGENHSGGGNRTTLHNDEILNFYMESYRLHSQAI